MICLDLSRSMGNNFSSAGSHAHSEDDVDPDIRALDNLRRCFEEATSGNGGSTSMSTEEGEMFRYGVIILYADNASFSYDS